VVGMLRPRDGEERRLQSFYPPHSSVRQNVEAFARACDGDVTYSVTRSEMLANVRSFDAITRSAYSGSVERLE